MFRPVRPMVAVTVQMVAASFAESWLWEPRAFLRVTTGPRMARSAVLLSLCRYRNNTNNVAERDARPVKVQQRASGGCWRTLQGLADFAVVQSYLSTAAKWGIDKLQDLQQLFTTGPWLPPAATPGITSAAA